MTTPHYGGLARPRCANHKDESRIPRLCQTCNRIAIEYRIVIRTIDALLAAGYALATDEGEHRFYGEVCPTRDRNTILDAVLQVDDEYLGVFNATEATGITRVTQPFAWVRFVYGNDGYDVISDYTVNLEAILAPVNAYADTQDPR